jgi:LysM repeat protein
MAEKETKTQSGAGKQEMDYPLILLAILLVVVGVLIYIGYDYLKEDTTSVTATIADASELTVGDEPDRVVESPPVEKTSTPPVATPAKKQEKKTASIEKPADKPVGTQLTAAKDTDKPAASKKEAVPSIGTTITHAVKAGETFSSIARRYNLSNAALKSLNPQIKDETKDMKSDVTQLKVRVKAVHTVGPGDVLSRVSTKYGVSKALIMAANGKTRDYAARGETLIIPLP